MTQEPARQSPGANPEPVERLIGELTRLPGIGRRSAERIAFHILKAPRDEAMRISKAITDVKRKVRHCMICYNLTDVDPCRICSAPARDASLVLVVEQPKDVISIEHTGLYKGVYHVLMGPIDPLSGEHVEDLTDSSAAGSGADSLGPDVAALSAELFEENRSIGEFTELNLPRSLASL